MVKKWLVFFRRVQYILKYVLLGIGMALFLFWGQGKLSGALTPISIAQSSPDELRSDAQSLTTQGHEQLGLGKAEEALNTWERAMNAYIQLNDSEGIVGSQINQSLALQALGQYRRACQILASAVKLDRQENRVCKQTNETEQSSQTQLADITETLTKQEDSPVRAIALRTLGDVLRQIGNLDNSEIVLKESLEMAKRLPLSPDISANLLSLANTDRALYNRSLDLYDRTDETSDRDDAIKKVKESLEGYREAAKQATNLSTSKITLIQAKLNRLSLLLEFQRWLEDESKKSTPEIREQLSGIQPQIISEVDELFNDTSLFSGLPPIAAVYTRLNFAENLGKLKQKDKLPAAIQYAKDALQQAKDLEIQREEAYALGILGNLYDLSNELSMAQQSTEEALGLAQSIQAWDIAYQWQQQLGQIYEKNGKIKEAIAAYDSAVNTLDRVRQDLLTINPDVQFSFRENVKPVYGDLIRLLLQEPNQNNLNKVLEVNERLQLAELENFLQCGSLNLVSLDRTFNKLDKPPAVIHTIVLDEAIEVVVQSPQKPLHRHRIPLQEVENKVNSIRAQLQIENIKDKDFDEFLLSNFKSLYKLLIAPAKSHLPDNGTLVFVLDSFLQGIPMALLQDEDKHYLIEKYSIALSLGSRVQEPKFLPWKQSRVLIAGVSEATEGFRALTNVPLELQQVGETTVSKQVLLDKRFTLENFQNELNASAFSIIHLATHGVFSSDPEKTFILAFNGKINVRQFDRLLRSKTQGSRDTIELLVLSACQTAKGDKRAGLGIAGVAVQAGARSTIASLWNVSDRSTALLMSEFYKQLKLGKTKSESLREAQLALLKNPLEPQYANPYYWAPFILAGNWL